MLFLSTIEKCEVINRFFIYFFLEKEKKIILFIGYTMTTKHMIQDKK